MKSYPFSEVIKVYHFNFFIKLENQNRSGNRGTAKFK
jgi:hypothetical protein